MKQFHFEKAEAGAELVANGFTWNNDESCWISADGARRASVAFNHAVDRYVITENRLRPAPTRINPQDR